MSKYNFEKVNNIFSEKDYLLLEKEYKNNKIKMNYICMKHEDMGIQSINLNNLLNNHGCKYCGTESTIDSRKLDSVYVKKKFESLGYNLLDEYEANYKKMRFTCINHKEQGIQAASYLNLLKNKDNIICLYCSIEKNGNRKQTIEYIKTKFEEVGFTLLETEYKNNKHPMKYICKNHPDKVQTLIWNSFVTGNRCYYCGIESTANSHRHTYEMVKNIFEELNYELLDDIYVSSHTPMSFICRKHKDKGIQYTRYATLMQGHKGCKNCAYESISGRNHYNWNGGVTEINIFLREKIEPWKYDSIKYYGHRCLISNVSNSLEVHHLYNFSNIVRETFEIIKLPIYEKIESYSDDELTLIGDTCLKLHYKYGFGVPLEKNLHKEFHSKYGFKNNTAEQFEEFKQDKLIEYQKELGDSA